MPGVRSAMSGSGEAGAKRILVCTIGNPGRGDDGLGWAFADALEAQCGDTLDIERCYQLAPEDAERFARREHLVLVDATVAADVETFRRRMIVPDDANTAAISSHRLDPVAAVTLAARLYGRAPRTELIEIRGYRFELDIGLSEAAAVNLDLALAAAADLAGGETAAMSRDDAPIVES